MDLPATANVYHPSAGKIDEIEVTEEDVRRGVAYRECPSCQGTGVAFWHPEFPDREPRDSDRFTKYGCVECSTRREVMVMV